MTATETMHILTAKLDEAKALVQLDPTEQKLEVLRRLQTEVIRFVESSKLSRLYDTSGPKQKSMIDRFRATCNEPKDIHIYCLRGANRSSKSWTAGICFCEFLQQHAKDGDVFYAVSPTQSKSKTGQGLQALIHSLLPQGMEHNVYGFGSGYTNDSLVVDLPDKRGQCLIKFKFEQQALQTFETDKIRGVFWDEAIDEVLFDTLLPRLADQLGFLLITSIPRATYWLKKRVILADKANYFSIELTTHDNAHNLPDGAIESLSESLSENERLMRVEGQDVVLQGLVFPMFRPKLQPEGHLCKPVIVPFTQPVWVYIDPGWQTCACLWITSDQFGKVSVIREYFGTHETTAQIATHITNLSDRIINGYFIDPQGMKVGMAMNKPVDLAKEFALSGIHVQPWPRTLAGGGKEAQVDRLRVRLENMSVEVAETCTNLSREFQSWSYKTDKQENPTDIYEKGNDHGLDCLMGACSSNLSWVRTGSDESVRIGQVSKKPVNDMPGVKALLARKGVRYG